MPVDMKTIPKNHLGALIAFVIAFILSLIGSYVVASVEVSDESGLGGFGDSSIGTNAWVSYATFGMLLLIVAAAIVAVRAFAPHVLPTGVPWQLIALAAAALGTLLIILRAITATESAEALGVSSSSGPGWSGYALFVAAIAQTVFTALGFRESGEQAPWQGSRTAGSTTGATTTGPTLTGPTTTGPTTTTPPPPAAGPTPTAPPPPPAAPPTTQPPSAPPSGPPPPA